MSSKRIGLKEIRSLGPGETIWDAGVPSFGARRQKGSAVAYVLKFRTAEGRQRWHTIGRHGAPWTPDTAREEARRLLGEVVRGIDPSSDRTAKRTASTVAELCNQYYIDAEAGRLLTRRKTFKKKSTLLTDKGRIQRHIIPLIGSLSVPAVSRDDIEAFMYDVADGKTAGRTKTAKKGGLSHVRGGKGAASRTVGLLGAIFTYAVRKHMRSDNPVWSSPSTSIRSVRNTKKVVRLKCSPRKSEILCLANLLRVCPSTRPMGARLQREYSTRAAVNIRRCQKVQ